jgi:hypothetical protein
MGALSIRSIGYVHAGPGTKASVGARLLLAFYIPALSALFAHQRSTPDLSPLLPELHAFHDDSRCSPDEIHAHKQSAKPYEEA